MASPGCDIDAGAVRGPPGPAPADIADGLRAAAPPEPVTLAQSLMIEAGWSPANFGEAGPNPPYLRIGSKIRVTLSEVEPCFASFNRDRGLFRSKVSMLEHLQKYDQIMVDPIAFEECFGPGEGTEATFPFGSWLTIRAVEFDGLKLWGRRHGRVVLPLEPLAIASAVWLRNAPAH
ncbi:hypothetical protein [Methylobacterium nigriterrae]|uniref:hypothetical protein n=1 Tax=Methylobacterium nigriterrae TaxID=3127512 RepID=UPI003013B30C